MGGSIFASIYLLPSALAITVAISSVYLLGKLFLNAGDYKKQIIDRFSAREGEDPVEAKKRILKNILKTIAIGVIASAAIAVGVYFVLATMLVNGFTWQLAIPLQTKRVVFAEYASVAALHDGLAVHKWKKGDKLGALFHVFAGALSFVFPAFY